MIETDGEGKKTGKQVRHLCLIFIIISIKVLMKLFMYNDTRTNLFIGIAIFPMVESYVKN